MNTSAAGNHPLLNSLVQLGSLPTVPLDSIPAKAIGVQRDAARFLHVLARAVAGQFDQPLSRFKFKCGLVGTAVLGGFLVIYLPPHYFSRRKRQDSQQRSLLTWVLVIGKNLLGMVSIVAGVAMLVLPGQGLLTIVIGLMLVSIPGKRELIANIMKRSGMLERVNHWRARFGRQPLSLPSGR